MEEALPLDTSIVVPRRPTGDAEKFFFSHPHVIARVDSCHKRPTIYRLIPGHVIIQSSGKQRVIDDAARGGQSERSRDANKLVLCSPLCPAQHEMLMIPHALIKRADSFRRRRGFWFTDNAASLTCLIRGRSDAGDLERIAQFIHIVFFALGAVLFWEYISTKLNWSDPPSRIFVDFS
jgi:hypothetical protein